MIFIAVSAAVFLIDAVIKAYIDRKYARFVRHPKCGGRVIIEKYYNDGAAGNFLADKPKVMRAIHTVLMMFVAAVYYFMLRLPNGNVAKTGIALIAGGGLNNLADRYRKGHVVDYVRFPFGPEKFRRLIFNVSDFFIFMGTALAVIGAAELEIGD
jgi:signal peptidase II